MNLYRLARDVARSALANWLLFGLIMRLAAALAQQL